jgi:hypothetical protein
MSCQGQPLFDLQLKLKIRILKTINKGLYKLIEIHKLLIVI